MSDSERKKGFDNRERIISAFIELSKTKGFYRVTMDELSAQAGLSKRTVYRYFKSKEEVIEAVIDHFLLRIGREMERVIAEAHTPAQLMARALQSFYFYGQNFVFNPLILEDLRCHYPGFWRKIDNYRLAKAQHLVNAILNKSDKESAREIDPRIITTAFLASIKAVVNPEFILKNGLTFQETMEQVAALFAYGFIKNN